MGAQLWGWMETDLHYMAQPVRSAIGNTTELSCAAV